jgi:hypothetical protein
MENKKEIMENREEVLKKREEEVRKREKSIKKMENDLKKKEDALKNVEKADDTENEPNKKFRPDCINGFDSLEIKTVIDEIIQALSRFRAMSDEMLRPRERQRLIGAGIRNLGFLQKAGELAQANPRFAQLFELQSLNNCLFNIDCCRNIVVDLNGFERRVRDSMMVYSDEAYSMALMFYNTVKEMTRRGDGDAKVIFEMLRPFFKTRGNRSKTPEKPSEKQIRRDVRALLHGKKDGEIIVKGHAKHETAGEHTVVDDTFKPSGTFKETVHGNI